jgi:hypothetical protein
MASQSPFPLIPPKSTELRLSHFDDYVYSATPSTILYKFVDALCGTSGAGALVNEIFLARMGTALETIYFNDLDYIFGKVSFLARSPSESYPYNPMTDMLTSDQWDEVRVKDAWYRSRIKDFFAACNLGGTPDGIRMCVQAALAVDCDIYEVWRYLDSFGLLESLGRAPESARNELVVRPHKGSLAPEELRLVRDMLAKICPLDAIITVNTNGLAVQSPVSVNAVASDSEYYEVQKMVTATPVLSQMPAPELLPIDLLPTQAWLYQAQVDPTLAPYTAFNISSEYGYYYLTGGGSRSPIDSVTYGTINPNRKNKISVYEVVGTYALPNGAVVTIPSNSWFSANLDPAFFQWISVPFPADQYPTATAITTGVGNLTNLINATPGPFILTGYSLGAMIISEVYDQIATGSLKARATDFLFGFAFGNPRRQQRVTFPNCTDPGGHGIDADNLMTNTPTNWWEFALPGDILAVCTDKTSDHNQSVVFESLLTNYLGDLNAVANQLTIPGAWFYLQGLVDLLFGHDHAAGPHFQYPSARPVKGDSRTCVQIAADQINSLKLAAPGSINSSIGNLGSGGKGNLGSGGKGNTFSVVCYEVTESPFTPSWFASNLDPHIRYIRVSWDANNIVPIEESIGIGVANLSTMITNNPGPFMFIGTGIGAAVTSLVYDQLRNGGLQSRHEDFVAAVAFGNPRREVGTIFPGGTDPGGHGIAVDRLVDTEALWWEFANPGDLLATEGDDTSGTLMTQIYESFVANYRNDPNVITASFSATATVNVAPLVTALINVVIPSAPTSPILSNPHATYDTTTPLSGDPRTNFQIARDYLNTFVNVAVSTVIPSADPMATYLPATNYQVFDTTGQYTSPTPYEKADSPDNYPGGKYGIHPDSAPALNPDGTPYHFPFVSQAIYVAQKVVQVLAQGGLAQSTTYQLPLSVPSSTAQVFYPNYAIAYYPPAKDSTISASITARHGNPASQITTEARDPVNFVRN